MMPILATKLYFPRFRPSLVSRPRLIARLNAGLHRKLTLIAAPAGFGKTTLVSAWVEGIARPTAWLSLDEGDNDPTRFLTYLVTALQRIAPNLGVAVLGVLQSGQPPPPEAILTALLNEITTFPDPFVFVLDDYHVIDAKPVDMALTYLVEHLPPQMHLIIATREDPPLPLARLRARGELTELRATDLRFTPSEAAEFLNAVMGLTLSPEDISALEDRTEGWIAGLQLAALSMQGREDIPEFIRAFTGDHRYILDYLVEEVLTCQPEAIRNFLLQTAILDRLSGSLCDAVTGQVEGNARLEALERGNFFVVALDDTRHWYRYHHLFAEVLSAHLLAEQPEQIVTLHRRASEWYEQHGSASEAIRHALAAADFARAADLVEPGVRAMLRSRQEATLLDWLKVLPDEVLHCRPVLSVAYAHVLLSNGEREGVEERLKDAERWLDTTPEMRGLASPPAMVMVVVDEKEFRLLPATIAIARAGLALTRGDVSGTVTYARCALDLAPKDAYLTRGSAAGLLGLASWTSGDLEAAQRSYTDGIASLHKAGNISDALGLTIAVADIQMAQGHLHEAMHTYEQGLQRALEQGTPVLRGTADMYVGMSGLYCEWNDLQTATQLLLKSKELGEHTGLPQNRYRWCVAMARIREAQKDLDSALDLLHEAERLYMGDFFPYVRPIGASVSRIWAVQGQSGAARDWIRKCGLSIADELSYLREFEHITLARVLLAQSTSSSADHSIREVMGFLERLLRAAAEGKRTGSVIDILVLQACAHQMQGDIPTALISLHQALTLAEPEGYVRMFVDAGPPMALLLEAAAKHDIAPNYVRHLLTAFGSSEDRTPVTQGLIEPLSERELEVLRLLASGLNGPEIARKLVVSLNTMRTHTKNIYSKLGVNDRQAAVRRAKELALFS
ncbi:LuxR family transcriptional regulator [Dictyobacter alpinus]|uniref:LuxR family transcriptional regulator n=1 Tax=Dictyobacter alpinus TaxID=2014873 RepID=A0A402BEQ7_9CHLR|nr:LuxR C-terminal-related transcriptional regulator [Dictyobacter alpinus]GCE29786.1 LuxR family transcriptional regulator [Dictyobacter alpinus]